jgi:hypothetical protein
MVVNLLLSLEQNIDGRCLRAGYWRGYFDLGKIKKQITGEKYEVKLLKVIFLY